MRLRLLALTLALLAREKLAADGGLEHSHFDPFQQYAPADHELVATEYATAYSDQPELLPAAEGEYIIGDTLGAEGDGDSFSESPPEDLISPNCDLVDPNDTVYGSSVWKLNAEVILTEAYPFDNLAQRLGIDYDRGSGYDIRGRFWLFDDDVSSYEIMATSFYLDFSKSLLIDKTELTIGGGAAVAGIDVGRRNEYLRYAGAGVSIFAEMWHPLLRFEKAGLGFVARGRHAVLAGRMERGYPFSDSRARWMEITELAFGLDYRRRFGRHQDKYWNVSILMDRQYWSNDWMSGHDSTAGFYGTSISFGVTY